jgi:hypothetical protein
MPRVNPLMNRTTVIARPGVHAGCKLRVSVGADGLTSLHGGLGCAGVTRKNVRHGSRCPHSLWLTDNKGPSASLVVLDLDGWLHRRIEA